MQGTRSLILYARWQREFMVPNAAADQRGPPAKLRVLVVDDNHDAADVLAQLVASWGCGTEVAYDGIAALEAAKKHPVDVALIDLGLPGMDGYQLALRLRRLPDLQTIKLIAVTGYEWQGAPTRSEEYGFDVHLV